MKDRNKELVRVNRYRGCFINDLYFRDSREGINYWILKEYGKIDIVRKNPEKDKIKWESL